MWAKLLLARPRVTHLLQARSEGALPGFVGSFSYNERNLFGLNQKLSALVEIGQVRP